MRRYSWVIFVIAIQTFTKYRKPGNPADTKIGLNSQQKYNNVLQVIFDQHKHTQTANPQNTARFQPKEAIENCSPLREITNRGYIIKALSYSQEVDNEKKSG